MITIRCACVIFLLNAYLQSISILILKCFVIDLKSVVLLQICSFFILTVL